MDAEFLLRFLLGGSAVTLFSLLGEMWTPKTFGGLFGAAPSVAVGALGIAYTLHDAHYVAVQARWMLGGVCAMFVYCTACSVACRVHGLPSWLEAGLLWSLWFVVSFSIFAVAH